MNYRIMYDSDSVADLRALHADGAPLVATYADLLTPADAQHFGGALAVIDRGLGDPLSRATIGDFEPGALNPADAGQWWDRHQHRGALTVYADRNDMPTVLRSLGPHRPAWRWWSTLDGTMRIGSSRAMVQFAGASKTGVHADATIIYHAGWKP